MIYSLNFLLASPNIVLFFLILIVFKISNRKENPFTKIRFWVIQILAGFVLAAIGIVSLVYVLRMKPSEEDNLANDLGQETIDDIEIVQWKETDTMHIENKEEFIKRLKQVEVDGPLKFVHKGRIIFTRMDGRKDSIDTNGISFGPYKGKWYHSEKNMLQEYFK